MCLLFGSSYLKSPKNGDIRRYFPNISDKKGKKLSDPTLVVKNMEKENIKRKEQEYRLRERADKSSSFNEALELRVRATRLWRESDIARKNDLCRADKSTMKKRIWDR